MDRLKIYKKETPEGIFYFADLGSELHGRISFRLWVSSHLVERDEYGDEFVSLPARAVIIQTPKGNWVLKSSDKHLTFAVGRECGYRGGSEYKILTPVKTEVQFEVWSSPRGNLGVSRYALVSVQTENMPLKYKWERYGRLYGSKPVGITIVEKDGTTSTIDGVDEIDDIASAFEE